MRERPILFSGEMVCAILEGRKTQTRRTIHKDIECDIINTGENVLHRCPYGQPGDRLWVRETWWFGDIIDTRTGNKAENVVLYKADGSKNPGYNAGVYKWHPSIHMRREYSRLNLGITNIRVERLQYISEEDCFAEGISKPLSLDYKTVEELSIWRYKELWESINGPDSWDKNPYVWVIEFRRL